MILAKKINQIKSEHDFEALVDLIPYAKFIGVETSLIGNSIVSSLPYMEANIGNPTIPALHGGLVAGFMENAAFFHLIWEIELIKTPKIIDFSIDYLRPGLTFTTYSHCEVVRLGKRVALCSVKAWQNDPDKPIAIARGHFLLSGTDT